MTITVNAADKQRMSGTFQRVISTTMGTSTARTTLDVTADAHNIVGSTATGFSISRALLPTLGTATASSLLGPYEGQEAWLAMTSTGEVKVQLGNGTATGDLTFTATAQWASVKYADGGWKILASAATLATATGTA